LDDYFEAHAIREKFEEGYLEERLAVRGAGDVIGHQIVGLLMDNSKMEKKDIFEVLERAYSFNIFFEEFEEVLKQLEKERLVFIDGEVVGLRRGGREYYFYNLTTIPKEKRFRLRDRITNRIIASLDEEFVVNLAPGETFSSKGKVWTVVDIEGEDLIAEPAMSFDFVVPSWIGEEIPVEWEIARRVARLREREVKGAPKENEVLIEIVDDIVVIHACFGTKINELFARIFAKKLSEKLRFEVVSIADAYRIMLKFPYPVSEEWVEGLFEIGNLKSEIERALVDSPLMRMSFLHVGRLFGLFGEDAQISQKMVRFMRGGAVYREALQAIFRRRIDVGGAEKVLEEIRKKKLKIVFEKKEKLSVLGALGVSRLSGKGSLGSFEPRGAMIKLFREELEKKRITLRCLNCSATRVTTVGGAGELKCHNCKRASVCPIIKNATDEEQKYMAGILRSYGKRGLLALLVYGVGAKTADRVLRRLHREEDTFYLDLIEEQKKFIKNKKYWSVR